MWVFSGSIAVPRVVLEYFLQGADWDWGWILQSERIGRHIPPDASCRSYSIRSSFLDWSTIGAFALSNDEATCTPNECMSMEGELTGVDLSRLSPKSFFKSVGRSVRYSGRVVWAYTRR